MQLRKNSSLSASGSKIRRGEKWQIQQKLRKERLVGMMWGRRIQKDWSQTLRNVGECYHVWVGEGRLCVWVWVFYKERKQRQVLEIDPESQEPAGLRVLPAVSFCTLMPSFLTSFLQLLSSWHLPFTLCIFPYFLLCTVSHTELALKTDCPGTLPTTHIHLATHTNNLSLSFKRSSSFIVPHKSNRFLTHTQAPLLHW